MKKLIKLKIENTTNLRGIEDSFCEIYSHDRNNGSFEFEITNDTLANETVTALFKFLRTGGYWKTTGTIEDNKIKVKFDTSLITQNEDVVCYLYLDDVDRDSDIFSFKFRVKLSELDKSTQLVHKERYINNNVVIDRLNVVTHEDLEKVKSLIPVNVVNSEDLNREIKRIDALETKADKDTVYDDSDLQERVKSLEARPVTSSYDDSEIKRKIKELEDRPAGSGNVDIGNLVTRDYLDDYFNTRNSSSAIIQADPDIETYFLENTDSKDVDKIQVRGYVYSYNGETKIFKQKNGDDLEFIGFQGAMITLANVLPKDYDHYTFNDLEKRVTLLTDRNFKEMVATPEFKAVVKESLREIVKEIIKEEN